MMAETEEEQQGPTIRHEIQGISLTETDVRAVKSFSVTLTAADGSTHNALIALQYGEIVIQFDQSQIILGGDGVQIQTNEEIEIIAGEKLSLESEKVVSIEAEEMIEIFGEESFVELSPTEIKIYAEDIEMDELLITGARGIEVERDPILIVRLFRRFFGGSSSDVDGIQGLHGDFIRYQQMRNLENLDLDQNGCR